MLDKKKIILDQGLLSKVNSKECATTKNGDVTSGLSSVQKGALPATIAKNNRASYVGAASMMNFMKVEGAGANVQKSNKAYLFTK